MIPLQKGASVKRNWRAINELAGEVSALRAGQPLLAVPRDARGLHPFQIYTMPACARSAPTADPANDWRRFRVRSGFILGTEPTGTDGAQWPDSGAFSGTYTDEITVDAEVAEYWFWLQQSGDTWSVQHDDTPGLAGWDAFPTPDAENIPIGFVDTATHYATRQAVVRQLLRADVVTLGGSGMHFHGEWAAQAYDAGSVVVVSSGTNIGTYVALTDAEFTDIPENGSVWAQLPSFGNGYWV